MKNNSNLEKNKQTGRNRNRVLLSNNYLLFKYLLRRLIYEWSFVQEVEPETTLGSIF